MRLLNRIGIADTIADDVVDEVRHGGSGAIWRSAAAGWLSTRSDAIWVLVLVAAIFRIGTLVTLPGVVPSAVRVMRLAGAVGAAELTSGGNLRAVSALMFGIIPYVSGSVVVQLAVSLWRAFNRTDDTQPPRHAALASGIAATVFAAFQAHAMVTFLEQQSRVSGGLMLVAHPGTLFRMTTVATLTAGSGLLMWISDSITRSGIANGMVLTFTAGVIAGIPDLFDAERTFAASQLVQLPVFFAVVLAASPGYRRALLAPANRRRGSTVSDATE